MMIFRVLTEDEGKQVIMIGSTEKNFNGGYYPDRAELFSDGRGWTVDRDNIMKLGLAGAMNEQRCLECGGIYFYHEQKDQYASAEACLLDLVQERYGPHIILTYGGEWNVLELPDGFYSMDDSV